MQNWEDPGEKFHGQTSHIYHYGGHRSVTDGRKLVKRNLNNRVASSTEPLYLIPSLNLTIPMEVSIKKSNNYRELLFDNLTLFSTMITQKCNRESTLSVVKSKLERGLKSMMSTYLKKLVLSLILGFVLLQGCAVSVREHGYDGYYYHHPHGRYYYHGYWR